MSNVGIGAGDAMYWAARAANAESECGALRAEVERLRLEVQAACTSLCPHGLDIAAQKENAERRLREYEHHVMTGRNEQHDRLVADNERLRDTLDTLAKENNKLRTEITFLCNVWDRLDPKGYAFYCENHE